MVLLFSLPLVCCSETIETVSVSDSERLQNSKTPNKRSSGFLGKYIDIPEEFANYSLYESACPDPREGEPPTLSVYNVVTNRQDTEMCPLI